MTMKTPEELNDGNMCEMFRFISGIDEMAMNAEMGLYFDFHQEGGYPRGCPGLDCNTVVITLTKGNQCLEIKL